MIAEDLAAYGMRDGRLLYIADVPSGLACRCVCACCSRPLVAKKGSIRRHHFAHLGITDCRGAPESVLHLLSKEMIAELDSLAIPPYSFVKRRKTKAGTLVEHQTVVAKGGLVSLDNVRVEGREDGFVPDIVIESKSRLLVLEVAVSHKVTRPKLRRMRKRDLPVIEIRLSASDSLLPRESLRTKLQSDLASKIWLFHPAQREAERAFHSKWRDAMASDRRRTPKQTSAPFRPMLARRSQPCLSEYDRTQDEFQRKHGRYPTMDECLKLWPHLWEP